MVLLTGCPPRHTEEEKEQHISSGCEILTRALEENYGLKEGEWQITSQKIDWASAYGFDAMEYSIESGGMTFEAAVLIDTGEVFTSFYGKEFGEMLDAYLKEKLEGVPEYRQETIQILSMKFCQQSVDEITEGMIPVSVFPKDFEAYLEKCEQEDLLNVRLTLAWNTEEPKEISYDLLAQLTQGTCKLPSNLEVKRFVHETGKEPGPMDLKEEYFYYDNKMQCVMTYEYDEVDENLIVRRRHSGDTVWEPEGKSSFNTMVDKNGHLSIYPEDEFYDLYFKGVEEGTKVFFLMKDSKSINKLYSRLLVKDPYFEDWCYATLKGDYKVRVGSFMKTEIALDQIKEKGYEAILRPFEGNIILCGINYNSKTKMHSCKISRA